MSSVVRWTHMLMADARPELYTWPDGQHRQNEDTVVGRVTWVSRRHFEAANQGKMNSWQVGGQWADVRAAPHGCLVRCSTAQPHVSVRVPAGCALL